MNYKTFEADGAKVVFYGLSVFGEMDLYRTFPTVVICPGGAYKSCADDETEAVALWLNSIGLNAAVLYYSCAPDAHFPVQLKQLATCVKYIKTHLSELNSRSDEVGVMGFSAGGHLAASLCTLWNNETVLGSLAKEDIRPAFQVLGYPVISSAYGTSGSLKNLAGTDDPALLANLSMEKSVGEHTPKTFLWTTWTDSAVNVKNTLDYATALRKAGVNTELHIFNEGRHGLSIATREVSSEKRDLDKPDVHVWTDLFDKWIHRVTRSVV